MITKRLLSCCYCMALITSTASWGAPEPEVPPLAQAEHVKPATDKAAPAPSVSHKPVSAPVTPVKPVPAPSLSYKPASAPVTPVKPVPAPSLSYKPASAPVTPVKPVPAPSLSYKPASAPATQVKPVQVPVTPLQPSVPVTKPALKPGIPANQTPALVAPPAPAASKLPPGKIPPRQPEAVKSSPVPAPTLIQPPQSGTVIAPHALDIEIFDREDCLQCDKAREFLTRLKSLQPQLKIMSRDVRKEPAALQLLKRMAQNQGNTELDYPAFVVGGQLIIGFSEEAGTAQRILNALAASRPANQQNEKNLQPCTTGNEPGCALIPPPPQTKPHHVVFNILGYNVQLVQIGLPLFTLVMGMLDGLNHSSLWVLMLIISLLAPTKDRTLMFTIAGTFIAAQGLIYFILMVAWFNLILQIDISRLTQILFAVLAFFAGAIYIKNYLLFGQNISLSAAEISKPGIYTRIRHITDSRTLVTALLATTVLAVIVQVSELTYSSVFPALYTRVLHLQHLGNFSNYSYLLLYDFAYMLDDLIVLALSLVTLNALSLKKFDPRILMLLSALTTLSLGAYLLLVKP